MHTTSRGSRIYFSWRIQCWFFIRRFWFFKLMMCNVLHNMLNHVTLDQNLLHLTVFYNDCFICTWLNKAKQRWFTKLKTKVSQAKRVCLWNFCLEFRKNWTICEKVGPETRHLHLSFVLKPWTLSIVADRAKITKICLCIYTSWIQSHSWIAKGHKLQKMALGFTEPFLNGKSQCMIWGKSQMT